MSVYKQRNDRDSKKLLSSSEVGCKRLIARRWEHIVSATCKADNVV